MTYNNLKRLIEKGYTPTEIARQILKHRFNPYSNFNSARANVVRHIRQRRIPKSMKRIYHALNRKLKDKKKGVKEPPEYKTANVAIITTRCRVYDKTILEHSLYLVFKPISIKPKFKNLKKKLLEYHKAVTRDDHQVLKVVNIAFWTMKDRDSYRAL